MDNMSKKTRTNVINLKSNGLKNAPLSKTLARGTQETEMDEPTKSIYRLVLSDRLVGTKSAEVWHLDGVVDSENWETVPLGEFSVSRIPKMSQPSHVVVGYLSPPAGCKLELGFEELWAQFKGIMSHLGYDVEGFYGSLSIMGQVVYFEEFEADLEDE